ncbi:hypothetical protein NT6N_05890 [Oceaniferula spumae]|uniref:Rhodanese domain-containing protein n=1 Tax=Oceaniferula spumae TaxID=2979115 RepID=A0AAT9FHW2_9BACT
MKIHTLLIAAVACLAVVAPADRAMAQAATKDKKAKASFADMSVKEVQEALKDGKITVIDVNGKKSYDAGHVPTAIHFASVSKDLAKHLPEDKGALILAYCSGPK